MRDVLTLVKYIGLYGSATASRSGRKGRFLRYLLLLLIGVLPPTVVVYLSNHRLYSTLHQLAPSMAGKLAPLFFNLSATMFGLFYLIGFVGNTSYSLARSEELEVLLTMPIRRSTLVMYSLLFASSSQFFTLGFYLGAVLGYAAGSKVAPLSLLLRTVLQLWFLSSAASCLSLLLGGVASRAFVRRLNVILVVLLLFVYFSFAYLQSVDVSKFGENEHFAKWFIFVNSKYNVLVWSFSEKLLRVLSVALVSLALDLIFFVVSSRTAFEPVITSEKRDLASRSHSERPLPFEPVYWKDFKLLQRNEQFLFLILYPFVFGVFMLLVTAGSTTLITLPFLAVGVLYCAVEAGILTSSEMKHWEVVGALPVRLRGVLLPKITIPLVINVCVFLCVLGVAAVLKKFTKVFLVFLPIYVVLLVLSGFIGSYFSIARPGKARNQPFDLVATFAIQGMTLGLAALILYPLNNILQLGPAAKGPSRADWVLLVIGVTMTGVLNWFFYRRLKLASIFKKTQ